MKRSNISIPKAPTTIPLSPGTARSQDFEIKGFPNILHVYFT
jgi:hypothetical protein